MSLEALRSLLQDLEHLSTGDGVPESAVLAAETEIGRIPEDYRSFLVEFGWMSAGPYDVYGLGEDLPGYMNLIHMTQDERQNFALPSHLIPIMNNGGGDLFCVAAGTEGGSSKAVVSWTHDGRQETYEGPTFSDWLADLLAETDVSG